VIESVVPSPDLSAEDQIRANTYRLLGTLIARPPTMEIVKLLRQIDIDEKEMDKAMAVAWKMLHLAASRTEIEKLEDEYQALFIGVGRGEVVPYASWYLTGFLMERPLAQLRQDLKIYGLERAEEVKEPEDHAGALCETMSLLIGSPEGITPHMQKKFFSDHIAPWMAKFFEDLQSANSASFYNAVGALGEQFIEVENQYLDMLPH